VQIQYGNAFSEAQGSREDLSTLRGILTRPLDLESDMCLVGEDGFFLSGLVPYAVRELRRKGVQATVVGEPPRGEPRPVRGDILQGIELRDWQSLLVMKCAIARRGIIAVPTGGGKTVIYAAILRSLGLPSLTMVGQVNHAEQMKKKFDSYGMGDDTLLVHGGSPMPDDDSWREYRHIVGVASSLSKLVRSNHPVFDTVQVLGVDEAHHMGTADTWQIVASECTARYRYALSATPFEGADPYENLFDLALIGLTGDIIVDMPVQFLQQRSELATATVYMQPVTKPLVPVPDYKNIRWAYSRDNGIVKHSTRNAMLLNQIEKLHSDPDTRTLVLVSQIKHGDMFVEKLSKRGISTVFLSGAGRVRGSDLDRDSILAEFQKGRIRVLVGSVIFDEAVDLPQITDVVMAAGGKKVRRTKQRVGRSLRGTAPVRIWDMIDMHNHILRTHSNKRRETYESDGHKVTVGFPLSWTGGPRESGEVPLRS